jgi:hypothetical protein
MTQAGVTGGSGVLTDWISLGVLASSVPRDVVDDAVEETGKGRAAGRGQAAAARDGVFRDGAGAVR